MEIEKELKINFIPLRTKEKGIEVAKGEEADEIMHALFERNKELQNGKWKDGIRIKAFYKGFVRLKRKRKRRSCFRTFWIVRHIQMFGVSCSPLGI